MPPRPPERRITRRTDEIKAFFSGESAVPTDVLFAALYKEYYTRVRKICARGMRSHGIYPTHEILDELVQDVFMQIIRRKDTFDSTKPLKPWLFRIAYNTGTNYAKSQFCAIRDLRRTRYLEQPLHDDLRLLDIIPSHIQYEPDDSREKIASFFIEILTNAGASEKQIEALKIYFEIPEEPYQVMVDKGLYTSKNGARNALTTIRRKIKAVIQEKYPEYSEDMFV